jgi:hypothetical protein
VRRGEQHGRHGRHHAVEGARQAPHRHGQQAEIRGGDVEPLGASNKKGV